MNDEKYEPEILEIISEDQESTIYVPPELFKQLDEECNDFLLGWTHQGWMNHGGSSGNW